ncbi:hypothetical protein ZHAS_00015991 [Anopheles sinensis]|uniref:Uncharacterized protein n=1 Tax=Anopheles sinensis TaxID=74873 RepID=A0A084WCI5_ANOSI|nr:hypothetical protein ZHAS_00015991 [Anopheles sinensis]
MWKQLALTLLWWNVSFSSGEWWHSMESGSASHEQTDHWDHRDNRGPFEVYLKLRNEPEVARRKVKPRGPLFTTAKPDGSEVEARNRCVLHLICEDPDCGELCELCGSSSNEQHESDYSSSTSEETTESGKTETHPSKSVKSFKPKETKDKKLDRDKSDEAKPKTVQTNSKPETMSAKHADQSEKSSTEPQKKPVRKQTFRGRERILPKIVNRLKKFKNIPKPTVTRTTAAPDSWEQDSAPGKDASLSDKASPKSTISAKLRNNGKWEVNDGKQQGASHIAVATTTSKSGSKKAEFHDKDSLETLSSEMDKGDHDESFHKWKDNPTSPKPRDSDKNSDKKTKVVNERHSSEVSKSDRHKVIHGSNFEHKSGESIAPKKSPEVPKSSKHSKEHHDNKEQKEGKHTSSKSRESDSKKIKLHNENSAERTHFDKQKKVHDGKSEDSKSDSKKDVQPSDDSLQLHNLSELVKMSHYSDSSSSENMVLLKDGSDPKTWPYVVAKLVQTELETAHMIIKQKPIKSALLNLKDRLKPVFIATSKTLSKIFAMDAGELAKKADGGTTVAPPATTIPVPVAVPNRSVVKTPGDSRKRKRGRQRPRPLPLRRAVKGKLIAMRTQQPAGTGANPAVDLLANGCSCKCPALKSGAKVRHDRVRLAARRGR